jgi:hypothetical protein
MAKVESSRDCLKNGVSDVWSVLFIDTQPHNGASSSCLAGSRGLSSEPIAIYQTVSLGDSVNRGAPSLRLCYDWTLC